MKRVCVVLVALASIAHADARKLQTPATLIEVRWHSASTKVVSKVFSTGMWTRAVTTYDGRTTTEGGRLDSTQLDELKLELKSARWRVTKTKAHCQADSAESTEFYIDGRRRYTQSTCGDAVDDKTQKLIVLVGNWIALGEPDEPMEIDEDLSMPTP